MLLNLGYNIVLAGLGGARVARATVNSQGSYSRTLYQLAEC